VNGVQWNWKNMKVYANEGMISCVKGGGQKNYDYSYE
jgi:hypothetical protein